MKQFCSSIGISFDLSQAMFRVCASSDGITQKVALGSRKAGFLSKASKKPKPEVRGSFPSLRMRAIKIARPLSGRLMSAFSNDSR